MKKWLVPILLLLPAIAGNVAVANIRGASNDVKGSVPDVGQHARDVFKQLGITQTEESATSPEYEQTLSGKKGELDIQVKMKQTSKSQTRVDVIAKHGEFTWNKDYAESVLSKIIQRG